MSQPQHDLSGAGPDGSSESSDSSESVEPIATSADGLFDYYLEPSGDNALGYEVHLVGPRTDCTEQLAVIFTGFGSRASALTWIGVHARSSDLGEFVTLRSLRATHQWARAGNHHLLDQQAERLATAGGLLPAC